MGVSEQSIEIDIAISSLKKHIFLIVAALGDVMRKANHNGAGFSCHAFWCLQAADYLAEMVKFGTVPDFEVISR